MVSDLINADYLTSPLLRDVTLWTTSHYSDVFEGPGLDEVTLHSLDVCLMRVGAQLACCFMFRIMAFSDRFSPVIDVLALWGGGTIINYA